MTGTHDISLDHLGFFPLELLQLTSQAVQCDIGDMWVAANPTLNERDSVTLALAIQPALKGTSTPTSSFPITAFVNAAVDTSNDGHDGFHLAPRAVTQLKFGPFAFTITGQEPLQSAFAPHWTFKAQLRKLKCFVRINLVQVSFRPGVFEPQPPTTALCSASVSHKRSPNLPIQLLNEPAVSDRTITAAVGGDGALSIHVSSAVLAHASPYFMQKFISGEWRSESIKVDWSFDTLTCVLVHVYGAWLPPNPLPQSAAVSGMDGKLPDTAKFGARDWLEIGEVAELVGLLELSIAAKVVEKQVERLRIVLDCEGGGCS